MIALVVVALAFVTGIGLGSVWGPPPNEVKVPGPVRTVQGKPRPAVTVTGPPVVRVREQTPQNCLDALTGSDRLLSLFQQYRDAAAASQQALLADDPQGLTKATSDLNTIASRIAPVVENYRIDAGGCRNMAKP